MDLARARDPCRHLGGVAHPSATWINLRHRATTMDTLISLGVAAAYLWSLAVLLTDADNDVYFEVAAVVTVSCSSGATSRRAQASAAGSRSEPCWISAPSPPRFSTSTDASTTFPSTSCALETSSLSARARRSPLTASSSQARQRSTRRLLTGESLPVEVGPGPTSRARRSTPAAASWSRDRVGSETALAQIGRLVERAQSGKAPMQRLVDRVSSIFVPVVIVIAAVTLVAWHAISGDADDAITAAVAVLIVALPVCARLGHADRAARRHRPWRAARHPDQGPRSARVDPSCRHRRARQDRHGHDRCHDAHRRHHEPTERERTRFDSSARWKPRPSIRSPAIAAAAATASPLPEAESFVEPRGPRRRSGGGRSGRRRRSASDAHRAAACPAAGDRGRRQRRRGSGSHRRRRRLGQRGSGGVRGCDIVRPTSASAVARLRADGPQA